MVKIKTQGYVMIALTLALVFLLIVNVVCFYVSLIVTMFLKGGSDVLLLNPSVGAVIPFVLVSSLYSLLFACNSDGCVAFFKNYIEKSNYGLLRFLTLGMINTLVLYIFSSSYSHSVRILGVARCLPILNIFYYLWLIKRSRNKLSTGQYLLLYLKGALVLSLFSINNSPVSSQADE